MLDTGSSVSLVRAPSTYPTIHLTELAEVYRHVCHWPVVRIPMTYNNRVYSVEVLKVDDLPFPVLLGRYAPAFGDLLRLALPRITMVLHEDEQAGPSGTSPDADADIDTRDDTRWEAYDDFLNLQGADPTLTTPRDQVAAEDGLIRDGRRAAWFPHFEKVRGALWRVIAPEREGGPPRRQLLIPESYRKRVLEQAHGHPWAGHQE